MAQIKFKIIKNDNLYNVKQWTSVDFGKTYAYCGIGRFCNNLEEVNTFIAERLEREAV